MIGRIVAAVLDWLAYRVEVRLWMDDLTDDIDDREPVPYVLTEKAAA